MRRLRFFLFTCALGASLLPFPAAAQSSLNILYSFPAQVQSGTTPLGVIAVNGVLYGATGYGGPDEAGTVFELRPPASPGGTWTEQDLYSFTGQNGDGAEPAAGPVAGPNGVLYGTTWWGGNCPEGDCFGTVYELQPPTALGGPWTEQVIYAFDGANGDGTNPYGGVVVGPDGTLYGTAQYGGAFGYGAVFQLKPPAAPGGSWTETLLYNFTGTGGDGANPDSITRSGKGVLYGTTLDQFAGNAGTVFELKPPADPSGSWTETVLHSFSGGSDGCYPLFAPIIGPDGELYGTTHGTIIIVIYPGVSGDGTVFKLTPPSTAGGDWVKTELYNFGKQSGPDSPLIVYGNTIYGTAGNIYGGAGEIFKLQESAGTWTKKVLHAFSGSAADVPYGTLVTSWNGSLYATTGVFSVAGVGGTVYEFVP
jgi:uncharacterized repeat protein (TIGR03803 family)